MRIGDKAATVLKRLRKTDEKAWMEKRESAVCERLYARFYAKTHHSNRFEILLSAAIRKKERYFEIETKKEFMALEYRDVYGHLVNLRLS